MNTTNATTGYLSWAPPPLETDVRPAWFLLALGIFGLCFITVQYLFQKRLRVLEKRLRRSRALISSPIYNVNSEEVV